MAQAAVAQPDYGIPKVDAYLLDRPDAQTEKGRLDFQHYVWVAQLGGLLGAPVSVETTKAAADLGCGSGIWTAEFARKYPNAQVRGFDRVLTQRADAPSNCSFNLGDLNQDQWDWLEGKYDVLHGRLLSLVIKDWPGFFQNCHGKLNPGGWVETDGVQLAMFGENATPENSSFLRFMSMWQQLQIQDGLDINAALNHGDQMREAGFENVRGETFKWRIFGAPEDATPLEKQIAEANGQNVLSTIDHVAMALIHHPRGIPGGMSQEDFKRLIEDAKEDLKTNSDKNHYYNVCTMFYGQKPSV